MELKSKDFFDVAQNPADQVYYKSTKIVKAGRETYEKRPRRLSGDVSFSGGMRFVEFAGDVQQRLQVEVTRYRAKHRRYLEHGSIGLLAGAQRHPRGRGRHSCAANWLSPMSAKCWLKHCRCIWRGHLQGQAHQRKY